MSEADSLKENDPRPRAFAALGDPTRLALVDRLRQGGARSISELTRETRITRQAVTKHLRVLEGAGLVSAKRAGRERLYLLEPAPLRDLQQYLDILFT